MSYPPTHIGTQHTINHKAQNTKMAYGQKDPWYWNTRNLADVYDPEYGRPHEPTHVLSELCRTVQPHATSMADVARFSSLTVSLRPSATARSSGARLEVIFSAGGVQAHEHRQQIAATDDITVVLPRRMRFLSFRLLGLGFVETQVLGHTSAATRPTTAPFFLQADLTSSAEVKLQRSTPEVIMTPPGRLMQVRVVRTSESSFVTVSRLTVTVDGRKVVADFPLKQGGVLDFSPGGYTFSDVIHVSDATADNAAETTTVVATVEQA